MKDPQQYLQTVKYNDAFNEVMQFKSGELRWNEALSKAARDFLDEAAPCDLDKTPQGQSIVNIFNRHIESYEDLEIVTFKGESKNSGKDLIETMLAHQQFEASVKNGVFD